MKRLGLIFCLATSLLILTTFAQEPGNAPVEIRIPIAPTPVRGNGKTLLAYEFHLTNFLPREVTLNRIEVFGSDPARPAIAGYQDAALINAIVQPSAPSKIEDNRKIGGGMHAIVYMWLTFDEPQAVPRFLRHKFSFTLTTNDGKIEDRNMEIPNLEVVQAAPVVISSPLKGGTWVAANGPSSSSEHRRAMNLVGGRAAMAQRFAIDWLKLGDDDKAWHGDSKINANWYGYGTEVLAVADAVVASTKDGIPENTPLSGRAVPITFETIGGNYVILALRNGQYAFYAHLQPGRIRVKVGEHVHRGQVLGFLGNSGNSDAPHLHFHISNANSPLQSEGLPFVFESFTRLGIAELETLLEQGWKRPEGAKPEKRLREIPTENVIVRFD